MLDCCREVQVMGVFSLLLYSAGPCQGGRSRAFNSPSGPFSQETTHFDCSCSGLSCHNPLGGLSTCFTFATFMTFVLGAVLWGRILIMKPEGLRRGFLWQYGDDIGPSTIPWSLPGAELCRLHLFHVDFVPSEHS